MKITMSRIFATIMLVLLTFLHNPTYAAVLPSSSEKNPTTPEPPASSASTVDSSEDSLVTTSSPLQQQPELSESSSTTPVIYVTEPPTVKPLPQPKGRNLVYRNPLNNIVYFNPVPADNSPIALDYPEPVLTYKPADSQYYDYEPDVLPPQYQPMLAPDLRNQPRTVVIYPSESIDSSDMATAESNIVFRPLFTYRYQTQQKRRVYSRPSSSSSSSPNRNQQRGAQGYPYRYPSYGYPYYYGNAQFDTVA